VRGGGLGGLGGGGGDGGSSEPKGGVTVLGISGGRLVGGGDGGEPEMAGGGGDAEPGGKDITTMGRALSCVQHSPPAFKAMASQKPATREEGQKSAVELMPVLSAVTVSWYLLPLTGPTPMLSN
jgi:hypothetical protein